MKTQMLRLFRGVRNFLFSQMNKEFLIFLFFLFLSGVFWLMMTLNETYEKEVPVPVKIVGVPKSMVVTSEMEDTLRVTVRDKGYALVVYLYSDYITPVNINFQTYANRKTWRGVVPLADLQKMEYAKLGGASKITSIKPDRLEFFFTYGYSKKVPVRLAGTVAPGRGFYLARTRIEPDSVEVYANRSLLDSIKYVTTEPLRIVNFNDTVAHSVAVAQNKRIKVEPAHVKVVLYPDVLTEESMEVPIKAVNMPEGKVLRTFPSKVRVRFSVGASMFRNVRPEQFLVVADYNELSQQPSSKCTLHLRTLPHGVRNASLEMQQVDYLIELQ